MIGDYESASIMPQGKKYSRIQCGLIKKKIKKNKKAALTCKANNIFRTAGKDLSMILKIFTNTALGVMLEISG